MSSMSKIFKTIADAASSRSGRGDGARSSSGGGRDWRAIAHTVAQKVQEKTAPTDQGGARPSSGRAVPTGNARSGRGTTGGPDQRPASAAGHAGGAGSGRRGTEEEMAVARYEYLTRTAPPEQLEQVNRDAFGRLSPEQRDEVRSRFDAEFPASERPASSRPEHLARSATRAEVMKPGLIQRVLGGGSNGGGRGRGLGAAAAGVGIGAVGGGLLAAVAGGAVLSAAAGPLLEGIQGFETPEELADVGQLAEGVDAEGLLGGADLGQLGELGSQWGFGGNPFE